MEIFKNKKIQIYFHRILKPRIIFESQLIIFSSPPDLLLRKIKVSDFYLYKLIRRCESAPPKKEHVERLWFSANDSKP
jgi:hypothetical protein